MDESLSAAVALFNDGRYTEFQDKLEAIASGTRATSERQFYLLLGHLAESLHQIGNSRWSNAEEILARALGKLDDFVPRYRGLNTEAFREDFRRLLSELREVRAGRKPEFEPGRLPRLRVLPE